MFIILRNRFLKPFNLVILEPKSLISPFSSLQSSSTSSKLIPDSKSQDVGVIELLKSHGFTETQISKIARVRPRILSADPKIFIAPNFLLSIGIPKTDLPKLSCITPALLCSSLQNQLIPCHNFLKNVLVKDENVVKMVRQSPRVLTRDAEKVIAPNIQLLAEIGVSKTRISLLLIRASHVACGNHVEFKRVIEQLIGMGFDPAKTNFVIALVVLGRASKTTWDRKVMAFKGWGLSDEQVGIAFRSHPHCMSLSEEKISQGMEFYVNEMDREAAEVARSSNLLSFSFEKRIKPRCRVIKVLISKEFLKKTISLTSFILIRESDFLEKFVSKYEDKAPELLSIYKGKQTI